MAGILLDAKRSLVLAGVIGGDLKPKKADWGLSQIITTLAVRLNPDVKLKYVEGPLEGLSDDRLADNVALVMAQCDFKLTRSSDPELIAICEFLTQNPRGGNALTVAVDTIMNGGYPVRDLADDHDPLDGFYIIGRDGGSDVSMLYRDNYEDARQVFRVACAMQEGSEIDADDKEVERILRKVWSNRRFSEIEIHNCHREVFDEWCFHKPEVEVIHKENDDLSPEV